MTATLEEANKAMRRAVKDRLDNTDPNDEKLVGYKPSPLAGCKPAEECAADVLAQAWQGESCCEGQRLKGDSLLGKQAHPTSQAFFGLLDRIKSLHTEKTLAYGAPDDPFANVTAAAKCGVEPWRRALCDASDCVVRLQRYAHGQPVDFENAVMDGINWLLICWLQHNLATKPD